MGSVLSAPRSVYAASFQWLQHHLLAGGLLSAPRLVLAEVAGAIARRTGDPLLGRAAVQQLTTLPQLSLLWMTDALADAAATLAADLRLPCMSPQPPTLAIRS